MTTELIVTGRARRRGMPAAGRPAGLRRLVLQSPVYLVLVVASILALIPFLWMVVASTHRTSDLFATPLPFLPGGEFWVNLARLQESTGFGQVKIGRAHV